MKYFKKILLISMALVMLIPTHGFHFLFKIPAVVGHYQHHLEKHDSDQGFFTYLIDHLTNKAGHNQEHDEDRDTPFQHNHQGCCSVQLIAVHSQYILGIKPLFSTSDKGIIGYNQPFYHSVYLSSIWQPPKIS